jgi:non-specific serine/threonine protein kinase
MTLVPLGDLERSRGRHVRAGELYQECLARFAEIGLADHPVEHPYLQHNLGYVALAAGQPAHAGQLFLEAVTGYRRAGDTRGIAECLIGLGATAAAEGRAEGAVTLFAAGEATLAGIGLKLWHSNQADYQRWRGVACASLEPETFQAACAAGAALSVEAALALVPRPSDADGGARTTRERAVGAAVADGSAAEAALTPREREVAQLIAAGLTNRQIGQALVITEKTAANHVQRVLDKLGLHSRGQLAARYGVFGLEPSDNANA